MKDGIYPNIPDAEYRSAPGVSKSDLDLIDLSPLHFKRRVKEEPTPQMVLGTLTHRGILQPSRLRDFCHVRPSGLDGRTKEGKAWLAEHTDKPVIFPEDMMNIAGMIGSVWADKRVSAFIERSNCEVSFWRTHPSGIQCKGRPDVLGLDGSRLECIADIKTVGHGEGTPEVFARKVLNFRYHIQAAYYSDGLAQLTGKPHAFLFIAVEREEPWAVSLFALDLAWIEAGRRSYEANLMVYKTCVDTDLWPGYPDQVQVVAMPPWAQRQNLVAYQKPLELTS